MINSNLMQILEETLPEKIFNSINCHYYNERAFNSIACRFNAKVTLLHQNIISFNKHANELILLLYNLNINFDFIGLTEIGSTTNIDTPVTIF